MTDPTNQEDMNKLTSLVFRMLLEQKELSMMNEFIEEILGVLKWQVPDEVKQSIYALKDANKGESAMDIKEVGYDSEPVWKYIPRDWVLKVLDHFNEEDKIWEIILSYANHKWFMFYIPYIQGEESMYRIKPEELPHLESGFNNFVKRKIENPRTFEDYYGCVFLFCRFIHINSEPVLIPFSYLEYVVDHIAEDKKKILVDILRDFADYQEYFSKEPIIERYRIKDLLEKMGMDITREE